jgi:threonine-phosphate decarboxylase
MNNRKDGNESVFNSSLVTRYSSLSLEPHGGNIYRFIEERNIRMDEVIDFSASINPLGVPKSVMEKIKDNIKYLCHYPDPYAKHLTQALAKHLGIDPQYILCGNGSTELIYLTVRALKPEKVLIPIPTFSEYERACRISNELRVKSYELKKENNFDINADEFINAMADGYLATPRSPLNTPFDMAFLCNPNNPTGRLLKRDDVMKIADAAKNLRCYLVVDEAFIDFAPEESVVREVINNPYLIVLRSMTKFYALSGLRIGYGIFPLSIINTFRKYKEPWSVNTIAQIAGFAAIRDAAYKSETFRIIQKEKKILEDGFKLLGITYFPSSTNFYLIKHDSTQKIISSLRNRGIMIRDCSNFMGLDGSYMRIAVRSNKENIKLLKEIAHICRV